MSSHYQRQVGLRGEALLEGWREAGYGPGGLQAGRGGEERGERWGKLQKGQEAAYQYPRERDRPMPNPLNPTPPKHTFPPTPDTSPYLPSSKPSHPPPFLPSADWPTAAAQERTVRLRKQEELKRLLDLQLEQRRERAAEERQKGIIAEQIEEEKLRKQRKELEDEYRRELRSRQGLRPASPEPFPTSEPPKVPNSFHFQSKSPQKALQVPISYTKSPQQASQVPVSLAKYTQKDPFKQTNRPYPFPSVPSDSSTTLQDSFSTKHQGIQALLTQLKEESLSLSAQRQSALQELDFMRKDIHKPSLRPNPEPWRPYAEPRRESERLVLRHESRFVPIVQAGMTVAGVDLLNL